MTRLHQRILFASGVAVVGLSFAMALVRAMWLLEFDGKLDFWPFVAACGVLVAMTAGVASINEKSSASLAAAVIRLLNSAFVLCACGAAFLWLPINNRVGADLLSAVIANGLLLFVAVSYWWFVHRELRLAQQKPNQSPEPTATSVTPPAAQEPRQP